MTAKIDPGFVKGDSGNLPKIDIFMVLNYIKHDDRFNDAEMRNEKLNVSSRQCYGDAAVGYVSLRRDDQLCILNAKICPEHKLRDKPYQVTMIVNEKDRIINSVECKDCPAALGGCKHAVAFLMWTHRRSEEPSPTEVKCYWKKSALAKVAMPKQFITATDLSLFKNKDEAYSANNNKDEESGSNFCNSVVDAAKLRGIDSQITRHWFPLQSDFIRNSSLHHLMISFVDLSSSSVDTFLELAVNRMSDVKCLDLEKLTRNQSDNLLWFELRYGRITASKIYETAHCKTPDGSLVNEILGASKKFETPAMRRGKNLEEKVLAEVQKRENLSCQRCGLFLLPSCPIVGASPDAITCDTIIEVKCPTSVDGYNKFLPNGSINKKCKAQMFLQMLCANKTKGLFCVADPKFEENNKVTTVYLKYDQEFQSVIEATMNFWKQNIFPRLLKSVL